MAAVPSDSTTLAQGDLALLRTPGAVELLASRVPARLAYVARDGTPRVVPTWFHWTGDELVMATFVWAPHVHRPAARLRDLAANPTVAVTIDTETFPPVVLSVRGEVKITEVRGIAPEYAAAAHRYLGDEAATGYLAQVDQPGTTMARIALRPRWAGLVDFDTRVPAVMAS
jgi:Pyridoxamine 5'-phosphate oxidase